MALIFWRKSDAVKEAPVTEENPFPVSIMLNDPEGGAVEYVGDASMPVAVTNTATVAPAVRMVNLSFIAPAAGDYAAADVVSFSTAAGDNANCLYNIAAFGGVAVLDAVVAKCNNAALRWRLRLHFYRDTPHTADVEMRDNVAADWSKTLAGAVNYMGFVDIPAFAARGTILAQAQAVNLRQEFKLADGKNGMCFLVETLDAETNEAVNQSMSFDFYFLD